MSDLPSHMPALDNTMGALLVGVISSASLWGISCMQTYEYFMSFFTDDPKIIKTVVLVMICLDTMYQIFISHAIYIYVIAQYGNLAFLGTIVWSLKAIIFLSCLMCLFVQLFFTWRIWILSKKNIWVIFCVLFLVLAEFSITFTSFLKGVQLSFFVEFRAQELSILTWFIFIGGTFSDIAIAATLIFFLQRSKTGFKRSDRTVNKLILFSLNTGLVTSLCALSTLIVFCFFPTKFLYIAFYMISSHLYTISLLSTLNARRKIREGLETNIGSENAIAGLKSLTSPVHIAIQVNTEVERIQDSHLSIATTPQNHIEYELSVFEKK